MPTVYPYIGGTPSKARFVNSNGLALSGGKVYFYEAGTSTPKDTYSERTGTTANANPVVLDSRGEANIFLQADGDYKVTVHDSDDVLIYTVDNVRSPYLNEQSFSALTAETTPATGDLLSLYDVSASALRKMTLANILKVLTSLTAETTIATTDQLMMYDASASDIRKITLSSLYTAIFATRTWTDFTPTVTLVGGAGNTVPVYSTNSGRYIQIGNIVHAKIFLSSDGGNEGAGTGEINIALPVAVSASASTNYSIAGRGLNNATEYLLLAVISASATTVPIRYWSSISAIASFTGAHQNNATRFISIELMYEV